MLGWFGPDMKGNSGGLKRVISGWRIGPEIGIAVPLFAKTGTGKCLTNSGDRP